MKTIEVIMVRVYLTEAKSHLNTLLKRLHDWERVRGVTVFRGITGFGKSGKMHSSALLEMSLDLPVVVEFFEEPQKAEEILKYLSTIIEPGHVVSWPARLLVGGEE
jgi:uncharacterized protein